MSITRKRLGEILREKDIVTEQQIQEALQAQKATSQRIGQILVDLGDASEKDVMESLAQQMNVPYVDLDVVKVDDAVLALVPLEMQERCGAIPLRLDGHLLTVAMKNPKDVLALDDLRMSHHDRWLTTTDENGLFSGQDRVSNSSRACLRRAG